MCPTYQPCVLVLVIGDHGRYRAYRICSGRFLKSTKGVNKVDFFFCNTVFSSPEIDKVRHDLLVTYKFSITFQNTVSQGILTR